MLRVFLVLFAGYLPVYLGLLFFLRTKIDGYRFRTHVVSRLATAEKPWSSLFNGSTTAYGLLSLSVPVGIVARLGMNTTDIVGSLFLVSTGVATALVGVFPMDKRSRAHLAASILGFACVVLTGVTFAIIFRETGVFSPVVQAVNYLVLGLTLLLAAGVSVRRTGSSLLEWSAVVGTIAWNFAMSVSLVGMLAIH
jgi:hypothetical membrane protein